MTASRSCRAVFAFALLWALAGTGCKPTYTTGSVVQAISRICEKEYSVQVGGAHRRQHG
jgi:hypothetical protein